MPFWSLNSLLTEERITEMLEQFAERGMGGAFCHARPGLITEYLSDEWWRIWSHTLRECKRLGLECQIYDENSFPSVFAGGHTMANCPHVGVSWLECRPAGSGKSARGEVVATVTPPGGAAAFDMVRIAASPSQRMGGFPYVDILHPEATREFLRNTHEAYAARYADDFGSVIKYVFTDEPDTRGGAGFHFTDALVEGFSTDHGYDIRERLADLGFSTESSPEVRFDFFSTVNRLFIESFARPVYEWCDKHGLRFTGHYWDHTWPSPAKQPDNMALVRWMQAPGIDLLGFQFDHRDPALSAKCLLYVKEVSSVANQLGCERTLVEGYGARGYDMSLRDFKPITDYLVANGFNLNSPHLSHVSVAGVRKYEWPQTLSDHASWWDEYRLVADHDARMTYAATRGVTRNRVLVLHPTTSAWLHHVPSSFDVNDATARDVAWMGRLADSQLSLLTLLADNQIDFDLGDEFVMEELGAAEDGKLRVGERVYDVVVLPEMMENVIAPTVELLKAYLASGGPLLALDDAPVRVDGRTSDAVSKVQAEHAASWTRCADRDDLLRRVKEIAPPRVAPVDGTRIPAGVSILRRELDDGRVVLAFANPFEREVDARVKIEGKGLYEFDTTTGDASPVKTTPHGDGQVVDLVLGESGHALWLAVPGEVDVPATVEPPATMEADVRLEGVARVSENCLPIDYCDVRVGGEAKERVSVLAADTFVWKKHGFDQNPWLGVQYKRTILDRRFAPESGFDLTYRFTVAEGAHADVAPSLRLAVERPWLYRIAVNGTEIDYSDAERYFDEHMRAASIADAARPGENSVTLTARPFNALCEVMPVRILGDFSVDPADYGFVIEAPRQLGLGDWRPQGLPFYADAVRYTYTVSVGAPARGVSVDLGDWAGSVVRARVQGGGGASVAFPPYRLEIDGELTEGAHTLAIDVVGNMKNLMGPHFDGGLPGVWTWRKCPEETPPGGAYRFYPSGMMTDPVVLVGDAGTDRT